MRETGGVVDALPYENMDCDILENRRMTCMHLHAALQMLCIECLAFEL